MVDSLLGFFEIFNTLIKFLQWFEFLPHNHGAEVPHGVLNLVGRMFASGHGEDLIKLLKGEGFVKT